MIRLFILERDKYRCRIRLVGCTDVADAVDHIAPIEQGGAWYDPENLRAACTHCNSVRSNQLRGRRPTKLDHAGPSREW